MNNRLLYLNIVVGIVLFAGMSFAWHETLTLGPNAIISSGDTRIISANILYFNGNLVTFPVDAYNESFTWSANGGSPALNFSGLKCNPLSQTVTTNNIPCQITAPPVTSKQTYTITLTLHTANVIVTSTSNPDTSICNKVKNLGSGFYNYVCTYCPNSPNESPCINPSVSTTIVVFPALKTVLAATSNTFISADQQVSFSYVSTNGTGANTYSWTVNPSSGFTGPVGNVFTFTAPGNYVVTLHSADNSGEKSNATANVIVTPILNTSLNANKTLISADQWVGFTASSTGGTGSNVYSYVINSISGYIISGNMIEFTSPGTYNVHTHVYDLSGEQANSANVVITVTPALSTQLSANKTFISADQWVTFTNSTSGGTGSNSYSYAVSPSSGFSQSGNKFYFTVSGNYFVTLNVVDLSGEKANSTVKVTVTPALNTSLHSNRTYISADQAVTFSNTTTGGTGSNIYTFKITPSTGVVIGANGKVTFNTAGNYIASFTVNDLSGEVATAANVLIIVTPPLTINITANRTYISADQWVAFANFTSGGTGSNVYTFKVSPSSGFTQSNGKLYFTTAGNYTVSVNVTDLSGEKANASVKVQVTPPLTINVSANRTLISADQGVTVTNTISGGTGNNVVTYWVSPGSGFTQIGNKFTFNTAGNYTIKVSVSDLSGEKANATVKVQVTPPLVTQLNANRTFISADQNVTFTNITTGGTGSNAYSYSVSPSSGFSKSGNKFYFTVSGNYFVTLNVTDLTGEKANSTVKIVVTPALTANLTANRTLISADQSVSFANATTGGTGNNIYTFTISPQSGFIVGAHGVVTFTSPGNYVASFNVTDLSGEKASSKSITIIVTPALTTQLNANVTFLSADQQVHFTNSTSGGTGSNIYTFTLNNTVGVVHTSDGKYTFNNPGNYLATLNVVDLSGEKANSSVKIQVTPPLTINITANRTLISADQKVHISNTTTGGTGSNVYTTTFNNTAGVVHNSDGTYSFNTAGNYLVTVKVTDLSGEKANASVKIVVTPPLTLNFSANIKFISADQKVIFSNFTTGGTGSNVFTYTVNKVSGYTRSGNTFNFTSAGQYVVTLTVVDLSGESANQSLNISVTNPLNITLVPNRTLISADQGVSFTMGYTGGTGMNVFTYVINKTTGFTRNGNVITFTSPGKYAIYLHATDFSGEVANSSVAVITVTPPLTLNLTANKSLFISADQKLKFMNTTTGGTGSNIFTYTVNKSNGWTRNGNIFNFTSPGQYNVTLHVTDLSGEAANASLHISVTNTLNVTLVPNRTLISADQAVAFTMGYTGGTGMNHFTYVINQSSGYTRNGNVITFTSPGKYAIYLHATDFSGEVANSTVVVITVTPPLTTKLNANVTYISADQKVHFTNSTTGGTGSNVYVFTINNTVGVVHTSDGKYTFNNPGNYLATLNVTDLSGEKANSTVKIIVTPPLTANLTVNRTFISADQWVAFATATTGGTGSNIYTFKITPSSGFTVGSNGLVEFTSPGNYVASFTVNDLSGEVAVSKNITINVTPVLAINLTANRTLISADQSVSFTNSTSGGTGSNVYSYTLQCDADAETPYVINGNTITFTSQGVCNVKINVVDLSGEKANSTVHIQITPPLTLNLTANRTYISADQAVSVSNSSTGGTGSNVYSYAVSPNSGFSQNANVFTFTNAGNYTITLNVSDLSGEKANASVHIQVTPPLTINLTANRTLISQGQNVTLSNVTAGGTGSNSYWYSTRCYRDNVTVGESYSIIQNVVTLNEIGTCYIKVYVSDLSGEKANSTVVVTVTPPLTLNLTANRTLISADQGVSFTNSSTGGTGNNTYWYSVSPDAGFTQSGNMFNFTSAGNYSVTLHISDLSGENANATVNVTVTPPLTVNFTANRTFISADQGVSVANVTAGGTGSNAYSYSVSPNSGFSQNGDVFTFTTAGNYTITLNVSDLSSEKANASVQIQVTPPLAINLTANRTFISADQAISFANVTTGGTGSNVYTYNVTPNSGFTQNNGTISFSAPGNYSVTVYVVDLSGETANATVNVTVTPALTIRVNANRTLISADQAVTFTNNTSGGTGNDTFWYTVDPSSGFNQSGNTFNFTSAGNYSVTLHVSDLSGETANATVNVTVTPPLTINLSANRTLISVEQGVTFSNTTSGGTGNNTYYFKVDGTIQGESFSFGSVGIQNVTEYVSDASGEVNQSSVFINVTAALTINVTANRTLVSADQNVSFANSTTGGTGQNTYTYNVTPNSGFTQNGNVLDFSTPGNYTVTVSVVDISGEKANATFNVTVTPALTLNLSANRTLISADQWISFTNSSSGGTGQNVYTYSSSCEAIQNEGNGNIWEFTTAQNCTVTLNVTDLSGEFANATVNITVTPPLAVNVTPNRTLISADQNVSISNLTSGGTGNNTYTYTVSPESGFTQSGNIFTFTTAGNYTVTLNVSDLSAEMASANATIVVTPLLTTQLFENQTSVAIGAWDGLTNITTGGTGSNVYTYGVNTISGPIVTGFTFNGNKVAFANLGNYTITLYVTDLSGEKANSSVQLNVTNSSTGGHNPPPVRTRLIANRTFISADQAVKFTNVTVPATNDVYSLSVVPPTGWIRHGNVINFTVPGNYVVKLQVTHTSGNAISTANSMVTIVVTPALTEQLEATYKYLSAGQTVTVSNITTGGTGHNVFSTYTVTATNNSPVNSVKINGNKFTFNVGGHYYVTQHVVDLTGEKSNSTILFSVTKLLSIAVTPNRTLIGAGGKVAFNVQFFGGTPGGGNKSLYKGTLVITPGSGYTVDGYNVTFTHPGVYKVHVHGTDYSGETANSNVVTISVT